MVDYRTYRPHGSKRKYTTVLVFSTIPRDNPKTSKEGIELARFTHAGDAYAYAKAKLDEFNTNDSNLFHDAWAVVVR